MSNCIFTGANCPLLLFKSVNDTHKATEMATADKPRRASARAINKAGASISSSSASPATTAAPKASAASTAKKPPTSGSKRVAKKPTKYARVGQCYAPRKGFID